MTYVEEVRQHYESQWPVRPTVRRWTHGPVHQLPSDFHVLEFSPWESRSMWTYATCGMSLPVSEAPLELHLFSPQQEESLVELLTVVAHYHQQARSLGLGHLVNFGRPWLEGSSCDRGLISLPYLDGPGLENCQLSNGLALRCYWLIPITASEVAFAKAEGIAALEVKFEEDPLNYLDPARRSVV